MTNKLFFWLLFGIILIVFLYHTLEIITPFIASFIIAYALVPIINFLENKLKLSKSLAILLVLLIACGIITLIFLVLAPLLYHQVSELIVQLPKYKNYLDNNIIEGLLNKLHNINHNITDKIRESLDNFMSNTINIIAKTINNLWLYTIATVNVIIMIFLVPIILAYVLRDWDNIISSVNSLIPLKNKSKIILLFKDIDNLLSAYVRGQLNVCLLLSIIYIIGLSIIGIKSALLLGIISGTLIIIPIIGGMISILIVLITGYMSFGYSIEIAYIIILYFVVSILESYFITPKIIGDRLGLHPLWIIFSVIISGNFLGFIGIIFAIPIAGIIKILLHYCIDIYKNSKIYTS